MLFRSQVIEYQGQQMRVLSSDVASNTVWCIAVDDPRAWPMKMAYSEVDTEGIRGESEAPLQSHAYSPACSRKIESAWKRLSPLIEQYGDDLFVPSCRNHAVLEYAHSYGCSVVTLRKDLRRFWQRGQSKFALMPDYMRCGRKNSSNSQGPHQVTARRGRKSPQGYVTYQISSKDQEQMRHVIERKYLKDARITVVDAYEEAIKSFYQYDDGNQQRFVSPLGARPTLRQFRYFLNGHFDLEQRLRPRVGNSDFEKEHRKVLGTTLADCLGVGHFYEIDATIADVYLVASDDRSKIIGKPTLYLVVDRQSRLTTGFYFGLENASWNAAMQAIYSIAQDKRALCEHYGVPYDPADWPAHEIFPQEFLADRGEMISHASTQIVESLDITVTNTPSKRPDWKPLVESMFRLTHHTLRSNTPAYDPPSNATRRRGKHYEKDACLTINEFGKLILNAIIKSNRREILNYDLSLEELNSGVRPTPIELWNHGIATRAGSLKRYHENTVRLALLRKEKATVTEHGIEFRGCFYSCPQAIEYKWFERARKRRFNVTVSFDPRLVNHIYVHPLQGKEVPYLATLAARSNKYESLSFEEVAYYESVRSLVRFESEHQRLQNSVEFKERVEPVITGATQALKELGVQKSRTARRKDIKPQRKQELAKERQTTACMQQAAMPAAVNPHDAPHHGAITPELLAEIRASMLA